MRIASLWRLLFSPILYDDQETERISSLLHRMLITLTAAAGVITVLSYIYIGATRTTYIALCSFFLFLSSYILTRLRMVLLPSILTCTYSVGIAAYSIYTGDGIHDVAIILFPLFLLISSLLLHRGLFVVYALFAVVAVAVTGAAEVKGIIVTRYSAFANWYDVSLAAILTAIIAVLIWLLIDSLLRAVYSAQASERNYREIFNATGEAIFIHDATTGRIIDVNDAMLKLYGYERSRIASLSLGELSSGEEPFTEDNAIGRIRRTATEGPQLFTWRARRTGGELFWIEVGLSASSIGGEGRVLAVVRNIDERIRLEGELRHAEKMRAIGQLAGGIAHDFNNQLTGILAFADMLRRTRTADADEQEALDCIVLSAKRAAGLTRQLLSFARNKGEGHTVVDVRTIINETIAILTRSIDRRIAVSAQAGEEELLVLGDADQLQNALLNLGLNARDAITGNGHIIYKADTVVGSPGGRAAAADSCVRITITDNGCGMSDEIKQRIFEPFFTTKELGRGTGMGLAAVYGTVGAHGGTIEVHSSPGNGSSFVVLVPSAPREHSEPKHIEHARPPLPRSTGKIMIVDDEDTVRAACVRMVETCGFTAVAFADGKEALDYYSRHQPHIDLVMLDMIMPRMSGAETFAALKALNPSVRVIISSGYAHDGEEEALVAAGVRGFIRKPYLLSELQSVIDSALESGGDNLPGR